MCPRCSLPVASISLWVKYLGELVRRVRLLIAEENRLLGVVPNMCNVAYRIKRVVKILDLTSGPARGRRVVDSHQESPAHCVPSANEPTEK